MLLLEISRIKSLAPVEKSNLLFLHVFYNQIDQSQKL